MSSSSYSYSSSPARKRDDRSDYSDYSSSSESERGPRRGAAAAKRDGPRKAVLHVRNLTRNVNAEHLQEIFGNYGTVQNVELAVDHEVQLPKGYAYIEFADHDLAAAAVKHMDGGQIDSNVVSVGIVGAPAAPKAAAPPPPRGRYPNYGPARHDYGPPRRRGYSPPRRHSPPPRRHRRSRSRSPMRRDRSPPRRRDRSPPRRASPPRSRHRDRGRGGRRYYSDSGSDESY